MGTAATHRYAGRAMARASIARVLIIIGSVVALLLLIGIVLVVLEANRSNDVVQFFRDAAAMLAGPFDGMFSLDSNKGEKAVNWGIAAVVWFAIARLLARMLLRR